MTRKSQIKFWEGMHGVKPCTSLVLQGTWCLETPEPDKKVKLNKGKSRKQRTISNIRRTWLVSKKREGKGSGIKAK